MQLWLELAGNGERVNFDGQINQKIYEILLIGVRSEHKNCFGALRSQTGRFGTLKETYGGVSAGLQNPKLW